MSQSTICNTCLAHAITIILFISWGYLSNDFTLSLFLISMVFGGLLILASLRGRKVFKGRLLLITFLSIITLLFYLSILKSALHSNDAAFIYRIVVILLGTIIALVKYLLSFIQSSRL